MRLRLRRRRESRGVTVFVVVLVIAMLSAVGVFASKSSSLALAQGGYTRQATQTHYLTEYALDATLADLSTDVAGYVQKLEEYDATKGGTVTDWKACRTASLNNSRCYKFGREGLESRFGLAADTMLQPTGATATGQLAAPGSLGRANVEGHFVVEATELVPLETPMAGERAGVGAEVAYYAVTLTAIAEVGPPRASAGTPEDLLHRVAMSVEQARVRATLGPVPARR